MQQVLGSSSVVSFWREMTKCFESIFSPSSVFMVISYLYTIIAERRVEQHCRYWQIPLVALWQPKKFKRIYVYSNKIVLKTQLKECLKSKISSFTCICFFGSGATDFEMLLTSLWTSVKIWFRLSTFSFFTVLICDTANHVKAGATNTTNKGGYIIYVQKTPIRQRKQKPGLRDERGLTCLSVVVTGFALVLFFKCLFATWKTFFCFFPFCLFFAISPGERTAISMDVFVEIIYFLYHVLPLGFRCVCLAASALITHSDRFIVCSWFYTSLKSHLISNTSIYPKRLTYGHKS